MSGRIRRVMVVLLMASVIGLFNEESSEALSSCGCPPFTTSFACYSAADTQHFYCWNDCSVWENPYRHQCQEACDQQWFTCMNSCINCPV